MHIQVSYDRYKLVQTVYFCQSFTGIPEFFRVFIFLANFDILNGLATWYGHTGQNLSRTSPECIRNPLYKYSVQITKIPYEFRINSAQF